MRRKEERRALLFQGGPFICPRQARSFSLSLSTARGGGSALFHTNQSDSDPSSRTLCAEPAPLYKSLHRLWACPKREEEEEKEEAITCSLPPSLRPSPADQAQWSTRQKNSCLRRPRGGGGGGGGGGGISSKGIRNDSTWAFRVHFFAWGNSQAFSRLQRAADDVTPSGRSRKTERM